jgi:hypothetical protein
MGWDEAAGADTIAPGTTTSRRRLVSLQRSTLSSNLGDATREGSVVVNAEGETHTIVLVSVTDGNPEFYFDNMVITSSGEQIKLQLDGGRLSQAALKVDLRTMKSVNKLLGVTGAGTQELQETWGLRRMLYRLCAKAQSRRAVMAASAGE